MTLGHFLDAAYTVLVEEYRTMHGNLVEALDNTQMWRAGGPDGEAAEQGGNVPPAGESARIERENALALGQLQQAMSGVNFKGAL